MDGGEPEAQASVVRSSLRLPAGAAFVAPTIPLLDLVAPSFAFAAAIVAGPALFLAACAPAPNSSLPWRARIGFAAFVGAVVFCVYPLRLPARVAGATAVAAIAEAGGTGAVVPFRAGVYTISAVRPGRGGAVEFVTAQWDAGDVGLLYDPAGTASPHRYWWLEPLGDGWFRFVEE